MKKFFKAVGSYLRSTPPHVIIIGTALILLIAVVITASTVLGKYTTEDRVVGTFQVSNRLAARFALQEHKAIQGTDGSYTLHATELVKSNTYELIPGLTIPKDPYISVTDKTSIPAYIYLEVLSSSVSAEVTFSVNGTVWTLLDGVTGPHGGDVYTYSAGLVDETTSGLDRIPILTGDSFTLSRLPITTGSREVLTFYGYMIEPTTETATAASTFTGTYS